MTRAELVSKLRAAGIYHTVVLVGASDAVHVDIGEMRTAAQKKVIRALVKTVKGDATDKGVLFFV